MKVLIKFSLKRRFFNTSSLVLNILLVVIITAAFFADELVAFVNPSLFENQKVYLQVDEFVSDALMALDVEGLTFEISDLKSQEILEKDAKALVLTHDEQYRLFSKYPLDEESIQVFNSLLTSVHQTLAMQEMMSEEAYAFSTIQVNVTNQALQNDVDVDPNKQNLIFMVITSIYFTMLSFSTSVANEVVYEKSTRQLELILTSISSKVHFLSKMIIGWLSILIQLGCTLCFILFGFLLRNSYDQGIGLIAFANKTQLLHLEKKTFIGLLQSVHLEWDFFVQCFFILLFLMLGIIFVQMLLSIIASFVNSVEQAGSIQSPFYLILLAIYYFALSINTPYQLSEGIGFYCSFLPVLNMLLIPSRLLISHVPMIELLLSAGISLISMLVLFEKGSLIYQRGVLDYTGKGLFKILQSAKGKNVHEDTYKNS